MVPDISLFFKFCSAYCVAGYYFCFDLQTLRTALFGEKVAYANLR